MINGKQWYKPMFCDPLFWDYDLEEARFSVNDLFEKTGTSDPPFVRMEVDAIVYGVVLKETTLTYIFRFRPPFLVIWGRFVT